MRTGRQIVNARVVPTLVLDPDPYGVTYGRLVAGEIASRLQGNGSHVYLGDRGDPTYSFNGDTVGPVQRFVSAAPPLAHRPAAGTYHDAAPTIETAQVGDNPYADPAARIFAARMFSR